MNQAREYRSPSGVTVAGRMHQPPQISLRADVTKTQAQAVGIEVSFSADTKNFQGTAITWDYYLKIVLVDAVTLVFPGVGELPQVKLAAQTPGTHAPGIAFIALSNVPPGTYRANVTLAGATSTATGTPDPTGQVVLNVLSSADILTVTTTGPAVVSGTVLSPITLSNRNSFSLRR